MYNIIGQIGEIASSTGQENILDFLVPEKSKFKHVVGIDFNLKENNIEFSVLAAAPENEMLSHEKLMEFLYVGNEKANRDQFALSTENITYLISQSIPNLFKMLPENSLLKNRLGQVISTFFKETYKPNDPKYGKIINNFYLKSLNISFKREKEKIKDDIKTYGKNIADKVCKKFGLKPKETLFTILINGQIVAQHPDYKTFLMDKNIESAFSDTKKGICTICQKETDISSDTTRFIMKFYMTDKITFASNFDKKNFYKAVALCKNCYRNMLIGERWIDQHLKTRLGGFDVYILPQIVWPTTNQMILLNKLKEIPALFNDIKNISSIRDMELDLQRRSKRQHAFQENPFIWNFLFYKKSNSAFKIMTLIKDVPPSRIWDIFVALGNTEKIKNKFFQNRNLWFDLDQIYWLIPLKRNKKGIIEFKKVLQIYYNILNGYPLEKTQLLKFYTNLMHIHHFGTYEIYQIGKSENPNYSLGLDSLKWNLFFYFLKQLNLIEGGNDMVENDLKAYYPDGTKEFMDEMEYSEVQRGLALLGYVIGVVAYAQYKSNLKNKPILDKINYQGMSDEKVIRLFNEIFEKIRQYRKISPVGYSERWWATAKKLYESGNRNSLTADERVFYLLTGYALNLLHISPEEKEEINEENQNQ